MATNDVQVYKYIQFTASTAVPAYFLGGIFASSSTSGAVKIWDNSAASGPILIDTVTLTAGQYYTMPAVVQNGKGIFITVTGTLSATVFYN